MLADRLHVVPCDFGEACAAFAGSDFVAFAQRRAIAGSRCFRSYCGHCGQAMRVSMKTLKKEWLECKPTCDCASGMSGSYGGSPQESHDIAYHGGRFHSAEW